MESIPLSRLISAWDEKLRAVGDLAALGEWFTSWQEQHGLVSGGRPLVQSLRPFLLTPEKLESDRRIARGIASVLVKAAQRVEQDPDVAKKYLGMFYEKWADLISIDPGYSERSVVARVDILPSDEGVVAVEFNTTPGGAMGSDASAGLYLELARRTGFSQDWEVSPLPVFPHFRKALLQVYRDWGGTDAPYVVFAVPKENIPYSRLIDQMVLALSKTGVEGANADPAELEFDGEALRLKGRRVGVLVRVFFPEVIDALGDRLRGIMAAIRARAVCMVTSFRNTIAGNKSLFAMVTDPSLELGLKTEEKDLVRKHLPWTRVLAEAKTAGPTGDEIDLLPWVVKNQNDLVCKRADGYGGADVHLGWTMPEERWTETVDTALKSGNYLVQKRVIMTPARYPVLGPGFPEAELFADQNFFMTGGELAGYLCRLSPTPVTNLSQGATSTATLLARPRG